MSLSTPPPHTHTRPLLLLAMRLLQWWFLSVLALVLGGPLSWWLFYKRVFGAAQTDGGTCTYMVTFMFVMLHMAWCVWMVLGLPNLGAFSAGEVETIRPWLLIVVDPGAVTGLGFLLPAPPPLHTHTHLAEWCVCAP